MVGLKGPHGPLKAGLHSILRASTSLSSPPVASASLGTVPGTGTVGTAIAGVSYTSANVGTLYYAVLSGGTATTAPIALSATSGQLPSFTPSAAGSYQFALYTSGVAGTPALATSTAIAIAAAASKVIVLDSPGTVTSGGIFAMTGTLSNYAAEPALSISVDGAAAVTMTSTSPYLLSFTPSTGAPTGFSFTAQALSTGTHTIEVLDTTDSLISSVSVTAAAGATVGALPAIKVQANTAMAVGAPITLGHFFAKGDVPAGTWNKLIASTTGGQTAQVQVDQTNTWPSDGSLRFAALSLLSPIAFAAGQVASLQLSVGSSAISGSPITPAQMQAAGDFSVQVAGGSDYGGTTTILGALLPTAASFTGSNAATLTVAGGGSSPFVLSQPSQGGKDNIAMEVMALSGAAQTFTTVIQNSNPSQANGGLVLVNSATGFVNLFSTFGGIAANTVGVLQYSNATTYAATLATTSAAISDITQPFYLRIAYDGTNYTFLTSQTGAASSWTQVAQATATAAHTPNQIGFAVDGVNGACTLTASDWEVASGANLQGAAAASITVTTVPFSVSAQDVLASFTQATGPSGWGTSSPLGGWEMIRSGPVCSEFKVWRYLKRTSDGASHCWVKAKLYVRAWSDGAGGIQGYEPLMGMFQENSYGPHPSGTVGNTTTAQPYRTAAVSVNHGATQVQAFTGPGGVAPFTWQQCGWWGALSDGTRPWVNGTGSTKPSFLIGFDAAYANKTRCLPVYDIGAASQLTQAQMTLASNLVENYTPNYSNLAGDIEAEGNADSDPRYGYLSVNTASLLLNPLDAGRRQTMLAYAWSWAGWEMWYGDERTGYGVNTGTDSTTCPSPANPAFQAYANVGHGSPAWCTFGPGGPPIHHGNNGMSFSYGPNWDNSHTPSLWIGGLLFTGDAAFEEMAVFQSVASCTFTDQGGRNFTYNSIAYENVILGLYQMVGQERNAAHWIRQQGAASRMVRDAHPMKGYINRALSQNAACAGTAPGGIPYTEPTLAKFGILWERVIDVGPAQNGNGGLPHLFMLSDVALMAAIEARAGDYPGWSTLLTAMQPIIVGFYDAANGGSSYDFTVYAPQWSDGTTTYADWATVRTNNGITDNPAPSSGFRYGSAADGGLGTISGFPRAALYMAGWQDTPPTNAISVAQESYTRYKATYPGQAGVISYMDPAGYGFCAQFAIAPPPGVS